MATVTNEEFTEQLHAKVKLAAARIGSEVTRELKLVLSVPAPIVPGSIPPRAATRATPGAPPRKVSGHGRASVSYFVESQDVGRVVLYVGSNVIYMGVHERGDHKWLQKTVSAMMPKILTNFNRYVTQ